MLHEDEFIIIHPKTVGSGIYQKKFLYSITNIRLTLWTGMNIVYDTNRVLRTSEPPVGHLPLSEYSVIICELRNFWLRIHPAKVDVSLAQYGKYCISDTDYVMIMDTPIFEEFYVQLCSLTNTLTKTIISPRYFCSECGISLLYEQNKCWACERGI